MKNITLQGLLKTYGTMVIETGGIIFGHGDKVNMCLDYSTQRKKAELVTYSLPEAHRMLLKNFKEASPAL